MFAARPSDMSVKYPTPISNEERRFSPHKGHFEIKRRAPKQDIFLGCEFASR